MDPLRTPAERSFKPRTGFVRTLAEGPDLATRGAAKPGARGTRALPIPLAALLTALLSFGSATAAQAEGDPAQGERQAALCAACHGPKGISVNPLWPSLAGQQPAYLVKQMKAFRDGERVEITMQPFMVGLTDQDIEDLAAFYASLSPCP